MRIVKRAEFLAMPAGTVYTSYRPCVFGDLLIKGDTLEPNDWLCQQIIDAIDCDSTEGFLDTLDNAKKTGESVRFDFDSMGRDNGFEDAEVLFAVWESADVEALIRRLTGTLIGRIAVQCDPVA